MKFHIVYDRPGRLRVRCGPGAFTQEQGYGIAALLLARPGVTEVTTCPVNGSVLVLYTGAGRAAAVEVLRGLDRRALPVGEARDGDSLRQVDDLFFHETAKLAARYLLRKLLPWPVRWLLTLRQAAGYWKEGASSLAAGRLDVAVLDASSIAAALLQGSWRTAGSIMFLLNFSGLLEDYTRRRTQTALTQSLAIHVDTVWLVGEDGGERPLPMSRLAAGDVIRVRSGSMIPVDGTVTGGDAMVNEASMTGESLPVHKREGSVVYAGTALEEGSLTVRVTALAGESRIQQIVHLIESSEGLKAGAQSRAEHLADAIVPFSFLGAVAVGLATRSLTKALSVLMVDYSCAIKLSTPIAVISAMREAAAHRVMVKGGKFLEAFAEADTVVFDKTGTLTAACPTVEQVLDLSGRGEDELLRLAACIEEHFPHSMARAVTRAAQARGLRHEEEHAEVEYVVAHGVATTIHGQRALIGSHHFIFEDEGTTCSPEQAAAIEAAAQGRSVLYLAIGGSLAGALLVSDPPRPEAARALAGLRRLGIRRLVMLTGDQEAAARAVCRSLGLDAYRAQVLPADKAAVVEGLRAGGHKVIMVGDGINDSPALAAADVSVAMKDASDLAREVADITLLSSDLEELCVLRRLSRGMLDRIGRNYRFILAFNSALLALGVAGILPPATTALLHNASTMAISAGSMRPYLPAPGRGGTGARKEDLS
ncbi:heavy metal translocating P-type ATPase [uncultured Intestinimonas sp.]|uniref:heavy metal translocating P-type ATPase n=1 Tax=uncultured Intestinimonas sp. TaxID=1689265 RepID=UPI0025FF0236|nr:heavy metal translocating P-type ATPase [uncultured Intestinimonas sp.]